MAMKIIVMGIINNGKSYFSFKIHWAYVVNIDITDTAHQRVAYSRVAYVTKNESLKNHICKFISMQSSLVKFLLGKL